MRVVAVVLTVLLIAGCAPSSPTVDAAAVAYTERMAARIRAESGGRTVTVLSPLTLRVEQPGSGGLTGNLDRVFALCQRAPEACEAESAAYARAIVASVALPGPVTREALRLVVRAERDVDAADATLASAAVPSRTIRTPFLPGLALVVGADYPTLTRILAEPDLAGLRLDRSGAVALARQNVLAELGPIPPIEVARLEQGILALRGDYVSSRLIDHAAWAPVAASLGGSLLVAVPSSDTLLITRGATRAQQQGFAGLLAEALRSASRPVSPLAWRWTPTGWEPLDLRPRA